VLGGLFALKLIPVLIGFVSEITIFHLQAWSYMVRCGSMRSNPITHAPRQNIVVYARKLTYSGERGQQR